MACGKLDSVQQGFGQKWKTITRKLKRELSFYQLVLSDERTPKAARWLLRLAIGYVLLPFDLIPDFIPVIGHLDDIIIIPALVAMAMRLVPPKLVTDCRRKLATQTTKDT